MRIAVVCPYSLSRPGGVQGQVLSLAAALQDAGHDVAVLAPVDGAISTPHLAPATVIGLGRSLPVPANGSVAPIGLGPAGARRAVAAVRRLRADVVHLHEPLAPGAGYACLVACPQPKIGTFHRAGPSTAYRLLRPAVRWLAGRLDTRCAVSPQAAETARDALGGTYDVVGNGVELERLAGAIAWPVRGPTAIFVGRHERRKGLGVLLDAFARLPPGAGAPRTLWVVGDGPDTEALRARRRPDDGVEWLGRLGDDELARRLAAAHVLCAPSLGGESFGLVLVEAMAARAAVVASDLPGYAYVMGGHGLRVPPGDAAALADALGRALADASAGTGICSPEALDRAFVHASRWSMATLARRYVEIYHDTVARRVCAP